MTFGNAFWLLFFILFYIAYVSFVFIGRKKGYAALAARTAELRNQGVANVWMLYGENGVGYQMAGLRNTSLWTLLNTGYLAYISNQNLVIEFPWWGRMRQFLAVPITQINLSDSSVVYNRKQHSAVRISERSYVIAGVNIGNADEAKQRLSLRDIAQTSDLQKKFIVGVQD